MADDRVNYGALEQSIRNTKVRLAEDRAELELLKCGHAPHSPDREEKVDLLQRSIDALEEDIKRQENHLAQTKKRVSKSD